jgi:hypothetical protein
MKKTLLAIIGGALAGSLGHYSTEVLNGHAFAFTFANIGVPALMTAATAVIALFSKSPTATPGT